MERRDAGPARPLLFGLVAFIYISAFPYHPKLRSPNELCRLWQTRALVEYGTLEINRALMDYGYVGDLSVKDGRYFPSKAPLLSFAAVPVYAALRVLAGGYRYAVRELPLVYFARLFLTVLPTLLMLPFLHRFLRAYVDEPVADGMMVTYALGSLALSYSLLFMSHQTAAVLAFASFLSLWRTLRGDGRAAGFALAGAFAGAAFATEYTSALALLGVALYGAVAILSRTAEARDKIRRGLSAVALAAAGVAPFAIGLMLYQWACFGHPLHTGYRYLADVAYQPWHTGGFLGIRFPEAKAFLLSFFSPLRGLFALAPFLLLAFFGLGVLFARSRGKPLDRAIFWMTLGLLGFYAYFTSSFSYESWGWTTGPRHLTALVPFLVLPSALAIRRLRELCVQITTSQVAGCTLALGAAAGLCATSVVVTGLVSLVNYIPDSASNALFGLAIPLFLSGYWPPSLWTLLGIPAPWPGVVLVAAVVTAALLVALVLIRVDAPVRPARASWAKAALAAASVCAICLAGLALAKDSARDAGALGHLKSAWLAQSR